MGAIIRVSCRSCNALWKDLYVGCGMLHSTLEAVAPLFLPEDGKSIREYAGKTEDPLFDFEYEPAACPDCRRMVSVPVLRLRENGAVYTGVCPDCKKKVNPDGMLQKTICPVCGTPSLQMQNTGFWD